LTTHMSNEMPVPIDQTGSDFGSTNVDAYNHCVCISGSRVVSIYHTMTIFFERKTFITIQDGLTRPVITEMMISSSQTQTQFLCQ
jgi:hypothetical protein